MSRSVRMQRVERELREVVALYVQHEMHEPLPVFTSVTDVVVSPDLRHATVFFRLTGDDTSTKEAQHILDDERSQMQKQVAKRLALKFCPVLRFQYGVTPEMSEIDQMLWKLKAPRQ